MKNRSLWVVLPVWWLCHTSATAQQDQTQGRDVYVNPLTNNVLTQSNRFENELQHLQGNFSLPYIGTAAGHAPGGAPQYNPVGPPIAALGPVQLYPHLYYEASEGNTLPAQRVGGTNGSFLHPATFINEVSPGIFFKLGGSGIWTLDYTPSLYFYSDPHFRDTTDENVYLKGGLTNGNWILTLSQRYLAITEPLVETGTQASQETYATVLDAIDQMGPKTSVELEVDQNFRFLSGDLASRLYEWKTMDWFNYQFQPQLSAGIGLGGGYDDLSAGSDMPFEQLMGRMSFQTGTKLNLTVTAGAEEREFIHPYARADFNPIYEALALYQATPATLLSCTAMQTVIPSLYQGDINVITSVSAGVRQRLIGNLQLEVTGNYTWEPYTSIEPVRVATAFGTDTTSALPIIQNDTRAALNIRLSTTIRTRLTASIFCLLVDNRSSIQADTPTIQKGPTYSGVQGGIELEYKY